MVFILNIHSYASKQTSSEISYLWLCFQIVTFGCGCASETVILLVDQQKSKFTV